MSTKPRTIDHLGIESSSRYAQDQAKLDSKFIEESRFIPLKTEVSVMKPYLPTEFEEYLRADTLTLWASFEEPTGYFNSTPRLFSYQLIPSLGGYEKQETDSDKLEALEDTINKAFKDQQGQQEQKEDEKERKTLLKLLKTINKLDQTLTMINSRRNQYQRG